MLSNATLEPNVAPAKVSVGKCTPRMTREQATLNAQGIKNIPTNGKYQQANVASKKAADVWPEGKLNLSEALIILSKPGMASGGRLRRVKFFKKKYSTRSILKPNRHTFKSTMLLSSKLKRTRKE